MELALQILSLVAGVLFWQVFFLSRRLHRVEQELGLRKPARSLYED